MTIIPYSEETHLPFIDAMADYMNELNCGIPEAIIRGKLAALIRQQCAAGIIRADLCVHDGQVTGFSVYQIDTPESDWCKRPGWGFIREFYVAPGHRKSGLGRLLAEHTEQALRRIGAKKLYLTSTDAIPFWQKCGWKLTDTLCSNEQYILEK